MTEIKDFRYYTDQYSIDTTDLPPTIDREVLPSAIVERDLGPLNEWSRSLLHAKLSDETRRMEEARLAKMERKRRGLRCRKPYTRKPGTVHPKKKEATRRRQLRVDWANKPFSCVIMGYGAHAVDRQLWDKYIQPLWSKYDPQDLKVKKHRDAGTKLKPYTVYTMDVVHSKLGVVYSGNSQLLFDLSIPKE